MNWPPQCGNFWVAEFVAQWRIRCMAKWVMIWNRPQYFAEESKAFVGLQAASSCNVWLGANWDWHWVAIQLSGCKEGLGHAQPRLQVVQRSSFERTALVLLSWKQRSNDIQSQSVYIFKRNVQKWKSTICHFWIFSILDGLALTQNVNIASATPDDI